MSYFFILHHVVFFLGGAGQIFSGVVAILGAKNSEGLVAITLRLLFTFLMVALGVTTCLFTFLGP